MRILELNDARFFNYIYNLKILLKFKNFKNNFILCMNKINAFQATHNDLMKFAR